MEKFSNPLLARLADDLEWPSLRLTIWVAVGLSLLSIRWVVYSVSTGADLQLPYVMAAGLMWIVQRWVRVELAEKMDSQG